MQVKYLDVFIMYLDLEICYMTRGKTAILNGQFSGKVLKVRKNPNTMKKVFDIKVMLSES